MAFSLAIGKFDALHLGHRALIDTACAHGQGALLSFSGMAVVLGWEERKPLLTDDERQRVLQSWSQEIGQNIEIIEVSFADVRNLQPPAFIEYLQERFDIAAMVTGENFRFGFKRSGDVRTLKTLGEQFKFAVETVPLVSIDGEQASSSRIRQAIEAGDCALAARLLGRPYVNAGIVLRGDGRGQHIGFPTANIQNIENVIPATGVYAADVYLDNYKLRAAINVGHLPSIGDDRPLSVEAHILDWSGDCYDQTLRIEWLQRIRDEQKFNGIDALAAQIKKDVEEVRAI